MDDSEQSDGEYYVERDMQNFFSEKQSPMYYARFQGLDELSNLKAVLDQLQKYNFLLHSKLMFKAK